MYCKTLQCIALHCNVLQNVVMYRKTLQYIALHCNILQDIVMYCITLQRSALVCQCVACRSCKGEDLAMQGRYHTLALDSPITLLS